MNGNGERGGEAFSPSSFGALAANPEKWALFLDIDGTLVDIAPTPDAVEAPAGLAASLAVVMTGLGGALALVTGRGIGFVDRLFHPHCFPLAGLHGAELRLPGGRTIAIEPSPAFLQAKAALHAGAASLPGVIVEDKGVAVAVHYRLAPHHRDSVEALMREAAVRAGPRWSLQSGKMLVELKPAAADKGEALKSFMRGAPFAGRQPLAVGDDLTDEDMFAAAIAHGGRAIRIGDGNARTLAAGRIGTPAHMRTLLASLADTWERDRR
ncbi:trehalose 6-phosphate phosphatase [Pseudochelatococcus lubricantis]|uniref:Trehalose 6-phosphate phosphatase n=1 Tax=Pseudochelatococcus lubricantis TaxID=1538102 RepID=A0ABX0V3E3_9HYPH|nr:trehalose-phosphatase [Pseudochelatococcus lubricantis]NIJ59732.1 trehalose 6-phosphate phosphatase [Pseudochelatococcus lubricantis]